MKMNEQVRARNRRLPFYGLSIQQRLPLFICVLLLCTSIALAWLSHIGVKRAAMAMGTERLETLTKQLSSMFGQSATFIISATHAAADQAPLKEYLCANPVASDSGIIKLLDKLRLDSTWVLVELFDAKRQLRARSAQKGRDVRINPQEVLTAAAVAPDSCRIGKLYRTGDSVYYPIVASITDKKQVIGYLLRWRLQAATAKALAQFSQLLGTNARLYLGNNDGKLWTDLARQVAAPPVDMKYDQHFEEYQRPNENKVIASASPIPNTQWIMLIEFSQGTILETSRRFFQWVIGVASIVVIAGSLLAWKMSRSITGPLNKLTAATTAMAAGDYAVSFETDRRDEIGKLARAFNAMIHQVKGARDNLEKKVEDRTRQLNTTNKELEAFSYSVSHDLRAPLRAISGFAKILKEDYAVSLDGEANRLTDKVISNARKMGQLIDDLISFSKTAGKELKQQRVNMDKLANSCMAELLQQEPPHKYQVQVHALPDCQGDEALMRQVWMNLISNAIKYSAKTPEPRIEIGCGKNGVPSYFIRDNGVGFDMKYAPKLFGVFQRLHNQNEFEGQGIGLALVKRIINRHHGDISVEATQGAGAAFFFSIPNSKTNGQ